ncbi:MAG: DUF4159 domain-containing protein [Thermoplasmata archaeon]
MGSRARTSTVVLSLTSVIALLVMAEVPNISVNNTGDIEGTAAFGLEGLLQRLSSDHQVFRIGWLMIIDWDSDYPEAPNLLSIHEDKPSNWVIEYEPIWFDQILTGECLLSDYDIVVTTGHEYYSFTDEERTILEDYIQGGGILWMDDCGNIELDNLPFGYEIDFGSGTYPYWGLAYDDDYQVFEPTHPLMVEVYDISDPSNIRTDPVNGAQWFTPFVSWHSNYEVILWGIDEIWGLEGPAILAAQVGYGAIVASAMDITCGLEALSYRNYPAPRFDFRFVYNMLAWSATTPRKAYEIEWLPPILIREEFRARSTVPVKFTVHDLDTGSFVSDDTVFVELYDENGGLIQNYTYGDGDDYVRIDEDEEYYIVNWHTKGLDTGTYTVVVDFEDFCSQLGKDLELMPPGVGLG